MPFPKPVVNVTRQDGEYGPGSPDHHGTRRSPRSSVITDRINQVSSAFSFSRGKARSRGCRAKGDSPKGQRGQEDITLEKGHFNRWGLSLLGWVLSKIWVCDKFSPSRHLLSRLLRENDNNELVS